MRCRERSRDLLCRAVLCRAVPRAAWQPKLGGIRCDPNAEVFWTGTSAGGRVPSLCPQVPTNSRGVRPARCPPSVLVGSGHAWTWRQSPDALEANELWQTRACRGQGWQGHCAGPMRQVAGRDHPLRSPHGDGVLSGRPCGVPQFSGFIRGDPYCYPSGPRFPGEFPLLVLCLSVERWTLSVERSAVLVAATGRARHSVVKGSGSGNEPRMTWRGLCP
jgi:hypothetical protein